MRGRRGADGLAEFDEPGAVGLGRIDRRAPLVPEPVIEVGALVESIGARFEIGRVAEPADELQRRRRVPVVGPIGPGQGAAVCVHWMSGRHVTIITRMTVTASGRVGSGGYVARFRRSMVPVVAASLVVGPAAGCGTDSPATGSSDPAPATTVAGPTADAPAPGETSDEPAEGGGVLPPMHVVAGLGYPRDLLDRGRVNIRIDRPDAVALVLFDKQLVARHFALAPVEVRRTVVPTAGQVVAVQADFGEVDDCDDPRPVEAELVISYALGDDPTVRTGSIVLDDATTLDDIRLQVCTQRRVADDNEFELHVDEVTGETMTARLVIRRRQGIDRLAVDAISGTVLFGADASVPAGSPERVLEADEVETTIALTFTVNRCDPHAVGETTRKYGLDVYVAVGDLAAQRIDVPIATVVPQLDAMLDHCRERTGQ